MIVTVVAFFSFVAIQKRELTVSVAFTSLSLFNMLQTPLSNLPMFVIHISQTFVCSGRIDKYLQEDEVPVAVSSLKSASLPLSSSSGPVDTSIGFVKATFRWTAGTPEVKDTKAKAAAPVEEALVAPVEEAPVFELGPIDFIFPEGGLTVVSGPTGAGKTALLMSLLGETDVVSGSIKLPKNTTRFDADGLTNSVAYAGQTAWLQNLSIKENM